jgi:PH domain
MASLIDQDVVDTAVTGTDSVGTTSSASSSSSSSSSSSTALSLFRHKRGRSGQTALLQIDDDDYDDDNEHNDEHNGDANTCSDHGAGQGHADNHTNHDSLGTVTSQQNHLSSDDISATEHIQYPSLMDSPCTSAVTEQDLREEAAFATFPLAANRSRAATDFARDMAGSTSPSATLQRAASPAPQSVPPNPRITHSRTRQEGWLWKESDVMKQWRQRWVVLRGKYLFYCKLREETITRPKGVIDLHNCTVKALPYDIKKRNYCFCIVHDQRQTFYLSASSDAEMEQWIRDIQTAVAEQYQRVQFHYRGRDIQDPEDVKQIVKANQEIRQAMYDNYAEAYMELANSLAQLVASQGQLKELKAHRKQLVRHVKAYRHDVARLHAASDTATAELNRQVSAQIAHEQSAADICKSASDIFQSLENTMIGRIAQEDGLDTATQLELINASTSRLDSLDDCIIAFLQAHSSKKQVPRCTLADSLSLNVAFRRKLNDYLEHIDALTQEKLQRFERESEDQLVHAPDSG